MLIFLAALGISVVVCGLTYWIMELADKKATN